MMFHEQRSLVTRSTEHTILLVVFSLITCHPSRVLQNRVSADSTIAGTAVLRHSSRMIVTHRVDSCLYWFISSCLYEQIRSKRFLTFGNVISSIPLLM